MKQDRRGQLLIEVLVVMAVLAVIVSISSTVFLTSSRSALETGKANIARGLVEEELEAVKAAATEVWHGLYQPPNGTGDSALSKGAANHYYTKQVGGKWVFQTSTEEIVVNTVSYTRFFYVDNVSRDPDTRDIEAVYNVSHDDPSTQKVTVTVTWYGGVPFVLSEYVTRWRNRVCVQTNWNGGLNAGVTTCPTNTYGSDDNNMDTTASGSLKIKAL